MKYLPFERIHRDGKDIPEGEIFVVYTEGKASAFIITEEKPAMWAFCMKLKGEYTLSAWKRDDVDAKQVHLSMQQILYAKKNGWSNTGVKKINDDGEMAFVLKCLYCGNESGNINGACSCRGIPKREIKVPEAFSAMGEKGSMLDTFQ